MRAFWELKYQDAKEMNYVWKDSELGCGDSLDVFSGRRSGTCFSGSRRKDCGWRKNTVQFFSGFRDPDTADPDCILGACVETTDSELSVISGVDLKKEEIKAHLRKGSFRHHICVIFVLYYMLLYVMLYLIQYLNIVCLKSEHSDFRQSKIQM